MLMSYGVCVYAVPSGKVLNKKEIPQRREGGENRKGDGKSEDYSNNSNNVVDKIRARVVGPIEDDNHRVFEKIDGFR